MVASILVLPKGGTVTRRSIEEYAEAVRERYRRSKKATKTSDMYLIPVCSGIIAGESIMGIVVALLSALGFIST